MNNADATSVRQLSRLSDEIFGCLDLPNFNLDEEVSSSIGIVEQASSLIELLSGKLDERQQALYAAQKELAALRAKAEERTRRLTVAEEAIRAQMTRADRAEQLLRIGADKSRKLEQANQNLAAQLQRVVTSVSSSLSQPPRAATLQADRAA